MSEHFTKTLYTLQSVLSGKEFEDAGWCLDAEKEEKPSLIRTNYQKKQLNTVNEFSGLYKFADWLPVNRILNGSCAPVTYKSIGLANSLGLNNLYITFSGYWPEMGALMKTCSFKETEAYSVCARLNSNNDKILVVASAGNTARAFAKVCSDNQIPLLLCMPQDSLDAMWFDEPVSECVKLIVTRSGSDYFDAINLSNLVCAHTKFLPEGGAKNVARRDGMATTVLSAVTHIGQIPDYYFQAVGSGTGGIAAWEANQRLIGDGRFGNKKMKLMVSQNLPFVPIYEAWKADSRNILPMEDSIARKQIRKIKAKVLSNRKPPYGVTGGLFDALKDTNGDVIAITNRETTIAAKLFAKTEGIDIHPAAAVATASLMKNIKELKIEEDAIVMLNITGGGEHLFKANKKLFYLQPHHVFDIDATKEDICQWIESKY
ncbi:MAG: cysteate synthase [Lentimicrobiaceae bacterium]|nr:cysteate synthase [Lentimicrobiaceae bacterium]